VPPLAPEPGGVDEDERAVGALEHRVTVAQPLQS
jgi:hypothetical protein